MLSLPHSSICLGSTHTHTHTHTHIPSSNPSRLLKLCPPTGDLHTDIHTCRVTHVVSAWVLLERHCVSIPKKILLTGHCYPNRFVVQMQVSRSCAQGSEMNRSGLVACALSRFSISSASDSLHTLMVGKGLSSSRKKSQASGNARVWLVRPPAPHMTLDPFKKHILTTRRMRSEVNVRQRVVTYVPAGTSHLKTLPSQLRGNHIVCRHFAVAVVHPSHIRLHNPLQQVSASHLHPSYPLHPDPAPNSRYVRK